MTAAILSKPLHKLLVIGNIYNKFDKISNVENLIPNYERIIINGGIASPNITLESLKQRIQKVNQLIIDYKMIYIMSRYDLELLNKIDDIEIIKWFNKQCNILIVNYHSRIVLILDGGIPLGIKQIDDLIENLEISFVSFIKDKPWHIYYNGGLGYVISNSPISDKGPEYYNYSMQLGVKNEIYAQEVDEIGLKQTILI